MADKEVQARKAVSNTPLEPISRDSNNNKLQEKGKGPLDNVQLPNKPLSVPQTSSEGRKAPTKTSVKLATQSSKNAINDQVLHILQEMNTHVVKQGEKLESLTKRVDGLYEYDGEDVEDVSYDENVDSQDVEIEPPAKRPCLQEDTDGVPDIFKHLCEKLQTTERCDSELNENLASFINLSFRNGVCDETLSEMLKDIHRPVNCESLSKTKVNSSMWRLLKPQTRTEDMQFQTLQNVVVKAAINISKLLDKEADSVDSQSLEWGTNALALLGHANKLINNKRKENHRNDLDPRFYPLTSSSLPYTDNLYGDDINKNVKDIQDMSKLGRDVGRSSGYRPYGYNRRRGGRRGMTRGPRGRGGYQRPPTDSNPTGQAFQKNRMGPKK